MTILYVPRFGGTLILNVTPPVPPALNVQMIARKGTITCEARKGRAQVIARKGTMMVYGRKP